MMDDGWEREAEEAEAKGRQAGGKLGRTESDMWVLTRLIRAYTSGRYTRLPWTTIAVAAGAIGYFIWPFDAIPDFFLFIGYTDDIIVLNSVIKAIQLDIQDFLRWEAEESDPE